jgi:hypothetical protein
VCGVLGRCFVAFVKIITVSKYNSFLRTLKLLDGFNSESKGEDIGRRRSWVRSLARNTLGVEGQTKALGWD